MLVRVMTEAGYRWYPEYTVEEEFRDSDFRYMPASLPGAQGYLQAIYADPTQEDSLTRTTAEMLEDKDRENRALRLELFNTRADHWATLTRFAPAVQAGCMDTRNLYPVRSALPDMVDWRDVGASPHPVVLAGHRLLVQDLILAPMVHRLLRTVCSRMVTLNFQAMEVTSMRTTTELSELVVVPLVL